MNITYIYQITLSLLNYVIYIAFIYLDIVITDLLKCLFHIGLQQRSRKEVAHCS